jgi:glutaconate CoA-transferase subunit A
MEIDEGMFMLGLKAAACACPSFRRASAWAPTCSNNPAIRLVDSPYDDKPGWPCPRCRWTRAAARGPCRRRGVCQIKGPDLYMDDLFARASEGKVFVSCDELVDSSHFAQGDEARYVFWERAQTTGVVHLPGGAHPSSCAPLYGFDVQALQGVRRQRQGRWRLGEVLPNATSPAASRSTCSVSAAWRCASCRCRCSDRSHA